MRLNGPVSQRLMLRFTTLIASVVTVFFLLSTTFFFGAATHKQAWLSWDKSTSGADLVQAYCIHGQFHIAINFWRLPIAPPSTEPRSWHAGARYLPGFDLDVRVSDQGMSRYGFDLFWNRNGPRLYASVFGLYPALLLWGLVWLIARRKASLPGHCPYCRYDMRATPERCPECGAAP